MRKLDKKNVIEAFKSTKQKELLVTTDGHIFLTRNKSFCKRHCQVSGSKYESIKESEVDQYFDKLSNKSKPSTEPPKEQKTPEAPEEPKTEAPDEPKTPIDVSTEDTEDSTKELKIKGIEEFLKSDASSKMKEIKDFCKSIDPRMPVPRSKDQGIELIKAALEELKKD